jgi:hypothetical protein
MHGLIRQEALAGLKGSDLLRAVAPVVAVRGNADKGAWGSQLPTLFLIQLENRRVSLAGITRHPTEEWMEQMARNMTDEQSGTLLHQRYVLDDRDMERVDPVFFSDPMTSAMKALGMT